MAPQTKFARAGDVHVAYEVFGRGNRDVLHLSFGTVPVDAMHDEPSLERYLQRLGSFARVICFDRRGVGMSDPVTANNPPTVEQWMQDALAVLDAAGSERAIVVGSVELGLIAMLLAATHPNRVGGLVLINSFARYLQAPDYPAGRPARSFERGARRAMDPDAAEQGFDLIALIAPSKADDPEFREWWDRAGHRGASPAVAPLLLRVAWETDLRDILPAIHVPTLILQRAEARVHHAPFGRYLAEHIPGARYVELPGDDEPFWLGDQTRTLDEIEDFVAGERVTHDAERVLATVLFTDIVDSTQFAAEVGDRRWRELLDAHDAMTRRQIERFGGKEIKTTGDGFFVTFEGPTRAVRCAAAICDGARQLGLHVRAGVHIGECELRGEDVAGIGVAIGARIASMAEGDQVLASSTVKDLVVGSGLEFAVDGTYELKGVPGEWTVYALVR